MKKYFYLLAMFLICISIANSQQSTKWAKLGSFGGVTNDGDKTTRTIGGLFVVGEINDGTNFNWSEILFNYSSILDVEDDELIIPKEFSLAQNYPNPFNPSTKIEFSLPRSTNVEIAIYNILGQRVTTLVDDTKQAGEYSITWNGDDDYGRQVASGIYFYRIDAGEFVNTKKMVLLK